MRARGFVSIAFVGLFSARAQAGGAAAAAPPPPTASFDELAEGATRLDRADLVGWAWALTAACDQGDDVAQRQCKAVRDARAAALAGKSFVVDGDPFAFSVGTWDPAKKSTPITLRGCVACDTPLATGGKRVFVVGNTAAPVVEAGMLKAAVIHETARTFDTEAAAVKWRTEAVPRLKVELIFGVVGNPAWSRDGRDGLAVAITGFRVYDPCDGGIVCASPTASKVDPDTRTCGTVASGPVDAAAPAEELVDQLEPNMIQKALKPALVAANACFDTYGVPGEGKLRITIAGDGTIAALEQVGDFADTPTGTCIDKAVRAVTFPKSRKAKTTVNYPIVLR
jgi:hypothetical protein